MYIVTDYYSIRKSINKDDSGLLHSDVSLIDFVFYTDGIPKINMYFIMQIISVTVYNVNTNVSSEISIEKFVELFKEGKLIGVETEMSYFGNNKSLLVNIISLSAWELSKSIDFEDKFVYYNFLEYHNMDKSDIFISQISDDGLYYIDTIKCNKYLLIPYLDSILCKSSYKNYIIIENDYIYVPSIKGDIARYKITNKALFSKAMLMRKK